MGGKKCNVLKPLSSKIPKYRIYGFDIETVGRKNDFLMGSIVGKDTCRVFWNKETMIEHIINNPSFYRQSLIFATNLGFDILGLFANTKYFEKIEPLLRGSSFISAKYKPNIKSYKSIKFLDTLNFAPFGVKKMGEILNIPKLKTPKYIEESRNPKKSEYEAVEKYNIRDSKITYLFSEWMQQKFNLEGAKMRMTLASTSMDLFKRKYLKSVWYQEPKNIMEKLYNAYYGGRTEVIKRGYGKNLNYYDFNSLYPSVMQKVFPNANYQRRLKKGNIDIIETYEGISKIEVLAPEDLNLPFLPFRGETKLIFPIGRFSGWYTNLEIRKAIKLGYKILWIGEQIYYTRTHSPFIDYVNDQYNKRMEYKKQKSPAQIINKLFMNSLYGKFAQKIRGKQKIMHLNTVTKEKLNKLITLGKVECVGNFLYFTENEPSYIPHHIFPIYSIYTTAYGRIKLYDMASKCDVYYMDTDSIITKKTLDESNKLGELKLEYKIKEGIFVKPKMYAFTDNSGDSHIKVKGLPPSRHWSFTEFKKFLKKPRAEYTKFTKFKESNKRGFAYNEIIDVFKELNLEDEKRKWKSLFDYNVLENSTPLKI